MFASEQYELLDFGAGRKLERFGPYVLDRPSPAAEHATPRNLAGWRQAHARYERAGDSGRWLCHGGIEQSWPVSHGNLVFELKLAEFGHVGIFPEQTANWDWIGKQARAAARPLRVLNLFAYTGGSTLAAAAAGAEVVHVDAAANVVAWARRNAEASGLGQAPIRWITEDAQKFVRRELKRGNAYDAVMLDPPSYGHGPQGEAWKLAEHLDGLVEMCLELTAGRREFILLTCHSQGLADRSALLQFARAHAPALNLKSSTAVDMVLMTAAGAPLRSGAAVRFANHRAGVADMPPHEISAKPGDA